MKKRKIALLLTVVMMITTLLSGCGNKAKGDGKTNNTGDGPWYSAKYHDFMLDENEYVSGVEIYDGTVYMLTQTFHEESMSTESGLKKMSLEDFSITDLPLVTQKDYFVADLFASDKGIYYVLQYILWDDATNRLKEADYKLVWCDLEGNILNTFDIKDDVLAKCTEDMYGYVGNVTGDSAGNIFLSNQESFILGYDKEGNKICDIDVKGYGNGLITAEDGTVYYSYTDEFTWGSVFAPIDIENNKLGEEIADIEIYNSENLFIDNENNLYMTEDNSLKVYDMDTGEKTDILDWLEYDINGNDIRKFYKDDKGRFITYTENYSGDNATYEWAVLEESDKPVSDKIILTYATLGTDSDIADSIIRFNKNSDTYRIKVIDYYNDEDYEEGINAYNQALLDGNAADIISVEWGQYKSYARKGIYADLNELIANDKEFKKEDYFENIFKAYEIDGKMYAVPISFSIATMLGRTSVWGEEPGVDMKTIKEKVDSMPEDVELLDMVTKNYFVLHMLPAAMDYYVNWETGQCNFDSEEFITMLEIAKSFPDDFDYNSQGMTTQEKTGLGKILLYNDNFYDIASYQVTKEVFGEPITSVGYPNAPGNGATIENSGGVLAISEQSKYKDGAWEFVKYLLSEEYQTDYIRFGNPINKAAFDKRMEEAAEPEYHLDENGQEVESPKMTFGWDDFQVSVYHATEEDIKEYRDLVEGAEAITSYDEEILTMIEEETPAFFDGKKSAKDVANVIQGRVKIYVNENR